MRVLCAADAALAGQTLRKWLKCYELDVIDRLDREKLSFRTSPNANVTMDIEAQIILNIAMHYPLQSSMLRENAVD